jgi:hypothetical protein
MLISALARSTDMAQGAAFVVWLTLLLFLDLILLGVMIQGKVSPEVAVTMALANPLQVFRTAALALFDPQLIVLGPSAYVILDLFGATGYKVFALVYPTVVGAPPRWATSCSGAATCRDQARVGAQVRRRFSSWRLLLWGRGACGGRDALFAAKLAASTTSRSPWKAFAASR